MIVKRASLQIEITDHACDRYAERVLGAPVSKNPGRRLKRLGSLRYEIYCLLKDRLSGRFDAQVHVPVGDFVYVIKDNALVTVKYRCPQ